MQMIVGSRKRLKEMTVFVSHIFKTLPAKAQIGRTHFVCTMVLTRKNNTYMQNSALQTIIIRMDDKIQNLDINTYWYKLHLCYILRHLVYILPSCSICQRQATKRIVIGFLVFSPRIVLVETTNPAYLFTHSF